MRATSRCGVQRSCSPPTASVSRRSAAGCSDGGISHENGSAPWPNACATTDIPFDTLWTTEDSMIELELTRDKKDRRLYRLAGIGTVRLEGWFARTGSAEADDGRSWRFG